MAKYLLDLSEVEFEDSLLSDLPDELIIKDGEWECLYDVVEGQLPEELKEKIWRYQLVTDGARSKPIGINNIPEEAEIRPLLDEDDYEIGTFKNQE